MQNLMKKLINASAQFGTENQSNFEEKIHATTTCNSTQLMSAQPRELTEKINE